MKKILCIVFILCIVLLPGCKSKTEDNVSNEIDNQDEIINEEEIQTETETETSDNEEEITPPDEIIDEESIIKLLQKGAATNEISYDLLFTSEGLSMTSKYWKKGDKEKIESDTSEGIFVTIYDKDEVISYYPSEKTGERYTQYYDDYSSGNVNEVGDQYFKNVAYKFIENGTFDGEKYILVSMEDAYGSESKLWISTNYGIILRYEGEDEGGEYISEVKNISTNNISDDTFEVPSDIIIEDEL